MNSHVRPTWAQKTTSMQHYYDTQWGIACHDDRQLFEMLSLETYQIGLSWQTVLNKRAAFNDAFANFEPAVVAQMKPDQIEQLLNNPAIIRNRRKLEATVHNAQVVIKIQEQFGSFDKYLWSLAANLPIRMKVTVDEKLPAQTRLSVQATKRLKQDGFKLIGPVTMYAFMLAIGMVNARING